MPSRFLRCISLRLPLLPLILLVGGIASQAETIPAANTDEQALSIAIIPQDGFNLEIVDQLSPSHVVVQLKSPAHNWFAGTFTNLSIDKEVTIGLSMQDNDTKGNKADVSKWQGLVPVMTYADPTKYETYEWFKKDDQGRWVSGDPLKTGEEKWAGTGTTPIQSVIPADLAEQFLSADGKYWQAWREVDKAEAVTNLNIFRIKQQFALPTATVAMRVPYTYTYLQQFIERLQAKKLPGVFIDKIGITPGQRQLQVIRLEDPNDTETLAAHRTVLITAREHATEHATSYGLMGVLAFLCSERPEARTCRKQTTWLCVPIQDPDGSAVSTFDQITDKWYTTYQPATPSEVLAYARYCTDYINSDKTIDIAVALHNVEANENAPVYGPFVNAQYKPIAMKINQSLYAALRNDGYQIPEVEPYGEGLLSFRLFGWCALRFHSLDLCYELNDRYPTQRLSLARLQQVGQHISTVLAEWLYGEEGAQWHEKARSHLALRQQKRSKYFSGEGKKPTSRTSYELLELAY